MRVPCHNILNAILPDYGTISGTRREATAFGRLYQGIVVPDDQFVPNPSLVDLRLVQITAVRTKGIEMTPRTEWWCSLIVADEKFFETRDDTASSIVMLTLLPQRQ